MGLFTGNNSSFVGIDLGSSSIKIVELKKDKGRLKLLNYGFTENSDELKKDWQNDAKFVATTINKIRERAGITNNNAVTSLPTFAVFSAVINLSKVNKKELESAVRWEAKKVIPLPLEEMVLDWKVVEESQSDKDRPADNLRVLLTGAPRTLVKKYLEIFKTAGINLTSLETETFSLIRSLLGNDKTTSMIVEIGATTTDLSVVRESIPVLNRSIDAGGNFVTQAISKNLNVSIERAEQFKYDLGANSDKNTIIPKDIEEAINPVVNEIKYVMNSYNNSNEKKIDKIILSGGSAMLSNFNKYLANILNKNVIVGDPWSRISHPVELKPVLNELAPRMSVAVGLAMRTAE